MSVLLVVTTSPYGTEGPDQLVEHARVATIHDVAEAGVRCGRVVSF